MRIYLRTVDSHRDKRAHEHPAGPWPSSQDWTLGTGRGPPGAPGCRCSQLLVRWRSSVITNALVASPCRSLLAIWSHRVTQTFC